MAANHNAEPAGGKPQAYKYARNFMCCVDCNMPFANAIIILQSHVVYIYFFLYMDMKI